MLLEGTGTMAFWVLSVAAVVVASVGAHAFDGRRVLAEYGYGYGMEGMSGLTLTITVTSTLAGVTLADVEGTNIGDDLCTAAVATFYEAYGTGAEVDCVNEFSVAGRRSLLQPGTTATQTLVTDGDVYTYELIGKSFADFIKALPAAFEEESGDWPFPFSVEDATVTKIDVEADEEGGGKSVADVAVAEDGTFVIALTVTEDGVETVTVTPKDADGGDIGTYGVSAAQGLGGVAVTAEASAFEAF